MRLAPSCSRAWNPGGRCSLRVNTTLAAAGAGLAAAADPRRARFGKPDASLCANGWVCGLVAISAACAFVEPAEALVIGLAAGSLSTFAVELFEARLAVDDPGGVVPCMR